VTPAERVVVEAAVRWAALWERRPTGNHAPLWDAVQVLLAERAGSQPLTVEITWGQVVEGDKLYRAPNGGPAQVGQPGGVWREVTQSGPLDGGKVMRIHVQGLPRPIQPSAAKPVIVRRGKTGQGVDALGSVLWSGPSARTHESEEA
jgi:hypothetical protein